MQYKCFQKGVQSDGNYFFLPPGGSNGIPFSFPLNFIPETKKKQLLILQSSLSLISCVKISETLNLELESFLR